MDGSFVSFLLNTGSVFMQEDRELGCSSLRIYRLELIFDTDPWDNLGPVDRVRYRYLSPSSAARCRQSIGVALLPYYLVFPMVLLFHCTVGIAQYLRDMEKTYPTMSDDVIVPLDFGFLNSSEKRFRQGRKIEKG